MKGLIYTFVIAMGLIMASVSASATVTYVYTDPQGTPLAEADASGTITATFDYRPYGSQALGSPKAGPGYTGHVNDPDTGFVYMQARYYDPGAGRFLSTDPVRPKTADVLGFGRYAYVQNNPIINVDLSGKYHCNQSKYGDFCEKIASYVAAVRSSRDKLRNSHRFASDVKLLNIALRQIGGKGGAGPNYVPATLETATANTDQKGTTKVDAAKIDSRGASALQFGAQAIAHEARHDYDVGHGGAKTSEPQVRDTETNAYKTSRAVDRGYGQDWKSGDLEKAIDTSVELWKDEQ